MNMQRFRLFLGKRNVSELQVTARNKPVLHISMSIVQYTIKKQLQLLQTLLTALQE